MEVLSAVLAVLGILVGILGLRSDTRRRVLRVFLIGAGAVAVIIASGLIGFLLHEARLWRDFHLEYVQDDNVLVETFAGSGESACTDAKGRAASFYTPEGIDVDSDGTVYVAEFDNHIIRKVDIDGNVSVFAGSGEPGFDDGDLRQAQFCAPSDVCVDEDRKRIIVAEWGNHCLRVIDLDQEMVRTLAGSPRHPGTANGQGREARFVLPAGLDCGADGTIYVAEFGVNRIRKVDTLGNVTTFAGDISPGGDDGGRLSGATFAGPMDVVVIPGEDILVADYYNHCIRRIDAKSGNVSTPIGCGFLGFSDGSLEDARFNGPTDIVFRETDSMYLIVDSGNHAIRVAHLGGVQTLAGDGIFGFLDGGPEEALFAYPMAVCLLPGGEELLLADSGNNRIRRITFPERLR